MQKTAESFTRLINFFVFSLARQSTIWCCSVPNLSHIIYVINIYDLHALFGGEHTWNVCATLDRVLCDDDGSEGETFISISVVYAFQFSIL